MQTILPGRMKNGWGMGDVRCGMNSRWLKLRLFSPRNSRGSSIQPLLKRLLGAAAWTRRDRSGAGKTVRVADARLSTGPSRAWREATFPGASHRSLRSEERRVGKDARA